MTFGERMRELMAERGMSLRTLAKLAPCDNGYLSKISHDLKPPSKQLAERLDEVLDAGGELAALRRPARIARGADTVGVAAQVSADDWDDMERRTLLQLAALSMGAGALAGSGEPVRQLLARAFDSEPRDIEDWYLTCADHMHAIRTQPPTQVRDALDVDLLAIERQMYAAGAVELVELQRVAAGLSVLYANVMTQLADHGAAIRWFRTSQAAADATGDLDLQLFVRGAEAGYGLYGQRSPETVLRLTQNAQRLAGGRPSVGLALVEVAQAKALSLLGRHDEARERVRLLAAMTPPSNASDGPIPSYWTDDRITFTESWVYAHAGDEARADEARDRVLATAVDTVYPVNVRLHEVQCIVANGGYDDGSRRAAGILAALPLTHQSHVITHTAQTVLRAIPLDQHDRPAVRELRALTAGPAALT